MGKNVTERPWPLLFRWGGPDNPLPLRAIRPVKRADRSPPAPAAPPWLVSGPAGRPFDFCAAVRRLCADIIRRCDALGHVDIHRLLFGVTQARSGRIRGLQARVTPLRFHGGQLRRRRRGVTYQVQRYYVEAHEYLYLVTFCLPRFLDQEFDEKFITLFHELYHISPEFNGDLRRHDGRCTLHSRSQRHYDRHMADLARAYLAAEPDPDLHAFLRLNFAQLQARHGSVVGVVVPRPKVIPVPPGA
jgi:predicted metallopeptidase